MGRYPKIFEGGYRVVTRSTIEQVISLAAQNELSLNELRIWCALIEASHPGDVVTVKRLKYWLSPSVSELKIKRSLARLSVIENQPQDASYKVKIPRKVLRYLSHSGSKIEILVCLRGSERAIRKRRHTFRLKQQDIADEAGVFRESISRVLCKLKRLRIVFEVKSPIPIIRCYGKRYAFGSLIDKNGLNSYEIVTSKPISYSWW